ncbi:zf-HC2 domain-containing protein [candidate division FCPU426 bacterium]|nr:zf-HC2 domain-containing protein [candidate division FCPU426 bacterium]
MSCEYCKDKLEAYVLGLLEEESKTRVAEHISTCAACRAKMVLHQRAALLLDRAFQEKPAASLRQKTLRRLDGEKKHGTSWLLWGAPALAGAAALIIMIMLSPWETVQLARKRPAASRVHWQAVLHTQAQEAPAYSIRESGSGGGQGQAALVLAQDADTGPARPRAEAKRRALLMQTPMDELDMELTNPINDRSIYEDLGVATEVAKLLL